jgi:hypothetical protein
MMPVPRAASRQRRLPKRRAALAVLVAVMSGCASAPQDSSPEKTGAMAGAGLGMHLGIVCGPLAIFCGIPLGVVGGVVGLGAGATADLVTRASKGLDNRRKGERVYIGKLAASDFSPAGSLQIDTDRIHDQGNRRSGTLLVDLHESHGQPVKSIEVDIDVACTSGEVTYGPRRTYDRLGGSGTVVASEMSSAGIAPGPELDAVKEVFCSHIPGLKQSTNPGLYDPPFARH